MYKDTMETRRWGLESGLSSNRTIISDRMILLMSCAAACRHGKVRSTRVTATLGSASMMSRVVEAPTQPASTMK